MGEDSPFLYAVLCVPVCDGLFSGHRHQQQILKGEPGIVEKYKKFLSQGSFQDPIDLLKICGVDMTSPEPVKEALAVFGEYLEELRQL